MGPDPYPVIGRVMVIQRAHTFYGLDQHPYSLCGFRAMLMYFSICFAPIPMYKYGFLRAKISALVASYRLRCGLWL